TDTMEVPKTGFPAPPYPGPPLDYNAVQPVVQPVVQPAVQPVVQPVVQPAVQIVSQVVVMQSHLPKDVPGQMKCPHCQTDVVTKTEYKIGILTWIIFGVLLLVGCWPCYVIPFFVKECKDVEHSCPACNSVIHIHKVL
uniref:Si:ch211-202h22.9 n=1 Tax=Maylandia zebra TaxID=106582 RepID=A0A3P9BHU4_9CICH